MCVCVCICVCVSIKIIKNNIIVSERIKNRVIKISSQNQFTKSVHNNKKNKKNNKNKNEHE